MKAFVLLVTLAACGRFGFDTHAGGGGDDAGGGGDAGDGGTSNTGPRWVHQVGPSLASLAVRVAGGGGDVVAVKSFQGTLAVDGATLTGQSQFRSSAVVRYDAAGAVVSTAVLDASFCEMRDVTMRGDVAMTFGFTAGGTGAGGCDVAAGRQSPIAVGIARDGQQHTAASWPAGGANGQGWRAVAMEDGSIAAFGVYGAALTVGSPIPGAGFDPNAFVARFTDGVATPLWAKAVTGSVEIQAGPIAAFGGELCILGSHGGPATVLGVALPYAGAMDRWVARLDAQGNAKWVRAIGTSADEPAFGRGSVAALADGSCWVSAEVDADITLDGFALPVAGGKGIVALYGPGGTVITAIRVPNTALLVEVGGTLYGAMDIDAPYTLGGVDYTPEGRDVLVGELVGNSPLVLGVLGGAGDQSAASFAVVGPDALAVGAVSTGELVFGGTTRDTGATGTDVVAVVGF